MVKHTNNASVYCAVETEFLDIRYMTFQYTKTLGTARTLGLININVGINALNDTHNPAALLLGSAPSGPTVRRDAKKDLLSVGNLTSVIQESQSS